MTTTDLWITIVGFVLFYSTLFVVELALMLKYIKRGPVEDAEEADRWMQRHARRLRGTPSTVSQE